MTNEKQTSNEVKGLALSGDEVMQMNDKNFTISAEPFYRIVEDVKPEREDLIIPVQLANGTSAEWRANKTSQKVIMAKRGRDLHDWVGYKGEWIVKNQVVGKEEKNVIYLKA
jgi:hypothetical protein